MEELYMVVVSVYVFELPSFPMLFDNGKPHHLDSFNGNWLLVIELNGVNY